MLYYSPFALVYMDVVMKDVKKLMGEDESKISRGWIWPGFLDVEELVSCGE